MSLLRDVEEAAISAEVPLSVVLRKCRVLAARLGHKPLDDWVTWELDGYPNDDVLPPYRKHGTLVQGHLSGYLGAQYNNLKIPQTAVPEEHREWLFNARFREGVAHYEALVESGGDTFTEYWPAEVCALYGDKIMRDYNLISAWKVLPRSIFVGLLDAVRNKVLAFVLEIERANPYAGEAAIGSAPIAQETVTNIFTTNVYGGSNVWATGIQVSQALTKVVPGDWESLRATLVHLGLPEADVDELRQAIDADRVAKVNPVDGDSKTHGWLGRTTMRIASGALAVSDNQVTGGIIAGLVLKFLGI